MREPMERQCMAINGTCARCSVMPSGVYLTHAQRSMTIPAEDVVVVASLCARHAQAAKTTGINMTADRRLESTEVTAYRVIVDTKKDGGSKRSVFYSTMDERIDTLGRRHFSLEWVTEDGQLRSQIFFCDPHHLFPRWRAAGFVVRVKMPGASTAASEATIKKDTAKALARSLKTLPASVTAAFLKRFRVQRIIDTPAARLYDAIAFVEAALASTETKEGQDR